ncbi:MAG: Ppx/GppA family phosphatase, partial [Marinovum sp.]|nr:Ppx/GppA family phosphatase [Marinovum sp.]
MNSDQYLKKNDQELNGQNLIKKPVKRDLTRVGVVDIGSNSVRLVVFDGAGRSPAYFYNEKIMCGLGSGMSETNCLNPQGRARAVAALRRFQALAEGMGITPLSAVATAAVREAEDGPDFCQQVERETGLKIWVIDGKQEARLSAQGVLLGWPGSYGLVCDIGGSSMELAEISDGKVGKRQSSDLGPLKLQGISGGKKARNDHIKTTIMALKDKMGLQQNRLFLVGGSWRALARVDMERRNYPLHVPHEYRMSTQGINETIK